MLIVQVPAWLAETNAYILAEESGGQAVVVDAPPEPDAIGAVLIQHDLTLSAVMLTHGHIDHTGGSGELARATGASVYVHPDDDFLTLHPVEQLRAMFGMTPPGVYDIPEKFEALGDGDRIRLAGLEFEVRHTPGHTPGIVVSIWSRGDAVLGRPIVRRVDRANRPARWLAGGSHGFDGGEGHGATGRDPGPTGTWSRDHDRPGKVRQPLPAVTTYAPPMPPTRSR